MLRVIFGETHPPQFHLGDLEQSLPSFVACFEQSEPGTDAPLFLRKADAAPEIPTLAQSAIREADAGINRRPGSLGRLFDDLFPDASRCRRGLLVTKHLLCPFLRGPSGPTLPEIGTAPLLKRKALLRDVEPRLHFLGTYSRSDHPHEMSAHAVLSCLKILEGEVALLTQRIGVAPDGAVRFLHRRSR